MIVGGLVVISFCVLVSLEEPSMSPRLMGVSRIGVVLIAFALGGRLISPNPKITQDARAC